MASSPGSGQSLSSSPAARSRALSLARRSSIGSLASAAAASLGGTADMMPLLVAVGQVESAGEV